MADSGYMAVLARAVRGCSGCTCPRFISVKFYLELLDLASLIPDLETQGANDEFTGLVRPVLGQKLYKTLELGLNLTNHLVVFLCNVTL